VLCELAKGAERSRDPGRERRRVADFCSPLHLALPTRPFADRYGVIAADLLARGETIGHMDLLIAVAALEEDAPLLTANAREFERVRGIQVIGY
jgi:predicted nucleic acid-binding protein